MTLQALEREVFTNNHGGENVKEHDTIKQKKAI